VDARLLVEGDFLRAAHFRERDLTLVISQVQMEELTDKNNKKKNKGTVSFSNTAKRWVCNRTNLTCMIAMFGVETAGWLGKRVTLYMAPFKDPDTKEEIGCIRVRGSPDLQAEKTVEIKLPRRKPFTMKLQRTAVGQQRPAPTPPQAEQPLVTDPPADTAPEADQFLG
jgi:hypothetical protein